MDILRNILYPIIWVMSWLLEAFNSVLGSYGLSIIALSLLMTIFTYPITRYGAKIEKRFNDKTETMAPFLAEIKTKYKGEQQFRKIERLYEEYNYHPIKSLASASGFLIQFPFLLAAMLLFLDYPSIEGLKFGIISDLSTSDHLLPNGINLLPFVMSAIAIVDSFLKVDMTSGARNKFIFISFVLCALVYLLPAAVILYWCFNNLWSLLLTIQRRRKAY